jgi:hypothetical protein
VDYYNIAKQIMNKTKITALILIIPMTIYGYGTIETSSCTDLNNIVLANSSSNNITISSVETLITFDGNTALVNAVVKAIQASPSKLTYYNLVSYY